MQLIVNSHIAKKIAADGKLVANYSQWANQKFRDGEFLWEFWNYERQINLRLTAASVYSSHLAMKKVDPGIHSLVNRFVVEFNSHIGQIIFDIAPWFIMEEEGENRWQKCGQDGLKKRLMRR